MSENTTTPSRAASADAIGAYERSDRQRRRRDRGIRLGVLAAVLAGVTAIGVMHQYGGIKVVGVDALCPFGGIETLWTLIAAGGLVQRVAASSVILFVATLVVAVVLRRSFCGHLCPLGALQELFGRLGARLWRGARPKVPAALDRPARFLKYAVLAVFAVWTWQAASLVIRPYDPWVAFMHLSTAEVFTEFAVGVGVLVVSLVGSLVYERFFCKYLCPTGAFLGLVSRLSLFKVRRNAATCIDCGACDKACPTNVTVSAVETVEDPECINCNECVNACPVKDALTVATKGSAERRGTRLAPGAALAVTAGIFAVLIAVTTATGTFAWTVSTLAPSADGAIVSTFDVETIKGSMTIREVAAATGLPEQAFADKWGIAPADMGLQIKELAPKYGFDIHTDFRGFVKERIANGGAK